ncbi:MAG: TIGR04283 family arsenosugar biosynthesis glycosyltransferase [Proteobacteria bacterium]|nr:TIGR04283 family arsenosugar biosynthesis glycosyltransferase [Pseudomonadota bacterium]
MTDPTISVILPVLNEAANLRRLLPIVTADAHEAIVVDGGSADGSADIAAALGARVLHGTRGRGNQLIRGAGAARGEVLLFLHADSDFPAGGLAALARLLRGDPALVGGCFRLIFDGSDGFSRWLTGFYAWLRRRGVYYGDSGIFVRRTVYDTIGGFQPLALMEDFNLVRRLERHGPTGTVIEPPLVTSSRRFHGRHPVAIVAGWLRIHVLYGLGVTADRLAVLYDSERRR